MAIGVLAAKDLRVLLRDRRAAVVLFAMPVVFIFILGVALGEGFGQKPDDRLRITVVVEDLGPAVGDSPPPDVGGKPMATWAQVVLRDLEQTAGIRLDTCDRVTAERLVARSERSAILMFGPDFSKRIGQCSFLDDKYLKRAGLNPFFRDGVDLRSLDLTVLRDPTQLTGAAIIEQVAQVTMLRVVLPWMIGRAFEEVGHQLPIAVPLLNRLFAKYDLTAKTWLKLTRSTPAETQNANGLTPVEETSTGIVQRGSMRYQILVPSLTVMFAFFLVLTAGWLFVSERRLGTLIRLRVAPLSRGQILAGKMLPCLAISLAQGIVLLAAGKLIFGMSWGPQPLWLVPVVFCTSIAATGLALLVACVARTESQVAVYGTLLVLVLAGVSGCLMPRDLMPETMKTWSKITPHAWALDAYNQLLLSSHPQIDIVVSACGALLAFGVGFLIVGWLWLKLE
jgi:ABC-type multidrug transport system permease subunit